MKGFDWMRVANLADVQGRDCRTVSEVMGWETGRQRSDGTVLKAGGIDLLDLMKEGLLQPRSILDLHDVPGLDRVAVGADGMLRIGAMVTLAQIAADESIRMQAAALAQAAASSASPQLRAVATIGGNLLQRPRCWYFRSHHHRCARKGGDACFAFAGENEYHAIFDHAGCAMVHPSTPATALVALGAQVELTGTPTGTRIVPLEEFFVPPRQDLARENALRAGEILAAVLVPVQRDIRSVHLRQGELASFDWPLADVAVTIEWTGRDVCRRAAIVLGAAAPVPHRAREAEKLLGGAPVDEARARAAARAAVSGAAPLARNGYKVPLFETLVSRAILAVPRGVST